MGDENQQPDRRGLEPHEHDLILHEFDYIATTATQAQEDRVQVLAQYLTFGAALIAAVFALTSEGNADQPWLLIGLGLVFGMLGVIGFNSVKHLARLRKAWLGSASAMNTIKDQYIKRNQAALQDFFDWRKGSLPVADGDSVAKLISWNITLISAASCAVGVLLVLIGFFPNIMQNEVTALLMVGILFSTFLAALMGLREYAWHRTLFPPDKGKSAGNDASTLPDLATDHLADSEPAIVYLDDAAQNDQADLTQ